MHVDADLDAAVEVRQRAQSRGDAGAVDDDLLPLEAHVVEEHVGRLERIVNDLKDEVSHLREKIRN